MKIVKKIEKTANIKIFHTFLLSVYPILGLYALNIGEAYLSEIYRPLIISVLLTLILLLLLNAALKDWLKSGLIASLSLLVFYSYGHIYNYLKVISIADFVIGRHRLLLPAVTGLFIFGVIWILRRSQDATNINNMMNLVMVSIMIFPIYQIMDFRFSNQNLIAGHASPSFSQRNDFEEIIDYQPDIYFVILDAYGRADILKKLYGYDNRPFLNELVRLGFFVAECSQSNYPYSKPSIASTLNMEFIQYIWEGYYNKDEYKYLIWDSQFRNLLRSRGYITVALENGSPTIGILNANLYLSEIESSNRTIRSLGLFKSINNFETLLLDTTLFSVNKEVQSVWQKLDIESFNSFSNLVPKTIRNISHRRIVLYELEQMETIANIEGPKFVFAHIVSPHGPFVFDAKGEIPDTQYEKNLTDEKYKEGYTNQITYINSRIIPIMENLIRESSQPPIIILIGDHGPFYTSKSDRSANLTAIFLPKGGDQILYEGITPINIFRTISINYFGVDIDLVEDIHYYHPTRSSKLPLIYTPIPDPNENC